MLSTTKLSFLVCPSGTTDWIKTLKQDICGTGGLHGITWPISPPTETVVPNQNRPLLSWINSHRKGGQNDLPVKRNLPMEVPNGWGLVSASFVAKNELNRSSERRMRAFSVTQIRMQCLPKFKPRKTHVWDKIYANTPVYGNKAEVISL